MPKAPLLSPDEISRHLGSLRGWNLEGDRIAKHITLKDFRAAVDFLTALTEEADAQNHHPDVSIHWNELTLTLWTHASGGLTERDFRLAHTIDQMTEERHAEA
jgi:4a-hydroxytetrahydrobiopterin dehydratase